MSIEDRAVDPAPAHAAAHVRQYLESNGADVDHPNVGQLILLYTTGRSTGLIRRTPLRLFEFGDDLVVVASFSGAPEDPSWYVNLLADPAVWVRRDADFFSATAVPIEGPERDELWANLVVPTAPGFADFQAKTDRVIPLVRLVAD